MTEPTDRELECLDYVTRAGGTYETAAKALGITVFTVKWHLRRLYSRLGVSSKAEAVRVVSGWHRAA